MRSLCIAGLLLILVATDAFAQSVRGRVVDAETGRPIKGVEITLRSATGTLVHRVVSDSAGRFYAAAKSGIEQYQLEATHIAYQRLHYAPLLVRFHEGVTVDLKMSTRPIELEPLTITARGRDPRHDATYEGLYTRRNLAPVVGNVRVILKTDLEFRSGGTVANLMGEEFLMPKRSSCLQLIWNGHPVLGDSTLFMQTTLSLLEGVEYYRYGIDAPLEYRQLPRRPSCRGTQYHVVALWPRRADAK